MPRPVANLAYESCIAPAQAHADVLHMGPTACYGATPETLNQPPAAAWHIYEDQNLYRSETSMCRVQVACMHN